MGVARRSDKIHPGHKFICLPEGGLVGMREELAATSMKSSLRPLDITERILAPDVFSPFPLCWSRTRPRAHVRKFLQSTRLRQT